MALSPYLNNLLCEGLCDNFQKFRGIFSTFEIEGLYYQVGQELQVMGGDLHGQEHQHGEPVEEVVDGGPCKSPIEGNPEPTARLVQEQVGTSLERSTY